MEKILTISIAAYNMEKYLRNTLDSLIIKNIDLLEVLIVDDGSKDKTLEIAQEYEKRFPNTFKAVHKENGGYGSTINTSIKFARGKYFKQLDGDDWYNTENLEKICAKLKNMDVDVIYTPYIEYQEKNGQVRVCRSKIEDNLSEKRIEYIFKNAKEEKLSMHTLMYKTEILRANNIVIEQNCFYTDSEYAIYPFFYIKTMGILDLPLYVYRVGREGQSVSVQSKVKHYKDAIKVTENFLKRVSKLEKLEENLKDYIEIFMLGVFNWTIGEALIKLKPNKTNFKVIKDYMNKIKQSNLEMYNKLINMRKLTYVLSNSSFIVYKFCYYYIKLKDVYKKRIQILLVKIY